MATTDDARLRIDQDRLWHSIQALAQHGAYPDKETGLHGVARATLSDADVAARHTLIGWMEEAGLAVRIDHIGNIYGRREGTDPDSAPVMAGSHIDSVPTAGAFDGCLGVLGALEVVRTLNDGAVSTRRPLEIVSFTEEEGTRFGTDMLGSAVAAGRIPLAEAHALTDADGHSLGSELARTGFLGEADHRLPPPHAYVECHIEQGPILSRRGIDVGVVSGVQGISWQEVTIRGRAAHAGATPTELRLDAGLAAAATVTHLRRMVDSGTFGQLRATVGRLHLAPDAINIIPAEAVFTVDLRSPDDEHMAQAESALTSFLDELRQASPGLDVRVRRMARTSYVGFDPRMRALVETVADDLGLSHASLVSGAGHDAQEMAVLCPTAMVFVRGEHDGISHTPREYSTPEACAQGISVLAETIVRLADDV